VAAALIAMLALALAFFGACGSEPPPDSGKEDLSGAVSWGDISLHRSAYADVNGIQLNYLDWRGKGPPLVMIHGLGDNPHVFDDLAAPLRDHFHLVAYARRGHGDSDAPLESYDLATLVEDLRQLLDRLGIERTSLLGWGMGGNEITKFAGLYPQRVEKLVYLEAGYDWSDPAFLKELGAIRSESGPGASALRSLDAYRNWFRAYWLGGDVAWSPGLEAYLRDTARIPARGPVQPMMSESVAGALFGSLSAPPRDYAGVKAPALALYATVFFPADPNDPARDRRVREWERGVMTPFRHASMERIRRELRGVTVRQLAGNTYMSIGVRSPDSLADTIREFLLAR
jgi:pimeloyl-ACP methyl ester carboxylesterase